jgi:hypothetical protein
MTLNEVWLSVMQGSVGALVGLIGLFLVFRLTMRNERATTRQREAAAATDRARSRVGSAIADITTAAAELVRDVTLAPVFRVTAITDLTAAIMRFALEVGRDHPQVAAWALSQQQLITRHQGKYRNRYLNPIGRERRLLAWSEPAGHLAGQLVLWHTGKLEEDWFESAIDARI